MPSSTSRSRNIPTTKKMTNETMLRRLVPVNWPITPKSNGPTMPANPELIGQTETIFVNGPPGVYESTSSALGTERLWGAVTDAPGYSVIGRGDSVAAARHFQVVDQMSYVCTAGGGMVRFLSGQQLPVVEALKWAALRHTGRKAV